MSNSHHTGRNQPGATSPWFGETPAIAIQVSRDIVVASIQIDLDHEILQRFRQDLLQRVHESNSGGVILDLSGLDTLDSIEFAALRQIIDMTRIMGTESILVGLRPGVVSSLIEAGADVDGVRAAINLDAAYTMLAPRDEPTATDADEGQAGPEEESREQDNPQQGPQNLPRELP